MKQQEPSQLTYVEGRSKFIESWGSLGSNWGIPKTMAQIHALLLVSNKPMNCDMIMDQLQCSRGNANTNIRALYEWQLVHKVEVENCRKEYYVAEKDMWTIVKQVISNRKKKELEPLIDLLEEMGCVESICQESKEFCALMSDLKYFSIKADHTLDKLIHTEKKWVIGAFMSMIK